MRPSTQKERMEGWFAPTTPEEANHKPQINNTKVNFGQMWITGANREQGSESLRKIRISSTVALLCSSSPLPLSSSPLLHLTTLTQARSSSCPPAWSPQQ